MATMKMTASYSTWTGATQQAEITMIAKTHEDAQAFAAQFPKSMRVHGTRLSGSDEGTGYVLVRFDLLPNGTNKGKNETAIKRYRAFMAKAARLNIEITYVTPYANSYPTREEFEAAL